MAWFDRFRKQRLSNGPTEVSPISQRWAWMGDRRHTAAVPYVLPKDEREFNRLDFQHFMLRYVFHGDYVAPINSPASILDVGCGTGRWPIEMALQFPDANVIGFDLNDPGDEQKDDRQAKRPDNYAFVAGNVLEGLPFVDAGFDFVHMRGLAAALPANRWPDVAAELARVTSPGGWIELVEDDFVYGGPALELLSDWAVDLCARRGIEFLLARKIGAFLEQVGLSQVTFRKVDMPIGPYGGRLGVMAQTDYLSVLGALKAIIPALDITTEQAYEGALHAAQDELERGRCVWPLYVAFGQKV